jgi:hypothetical protein
VHAVTVHDSSSLVLPARGCVLTAIVVARRMRCPHLFRVTSHLDGAPDRSSVARRRRGAVHQRYCRLWWSRWDGGASSRHGRPGDRVQKACPEGRLARNPPEATPRNAVCSITRPHAARAVELRRCGAKRWRMRECVVAALPSHGRGDRFETCHAHQCKRLPGTLLRCRLPAACQQTTSSGCSSA